MSQRILVSALVAGAGVGILAALLQFVFVLPLLLEGELYETGLRVHFADGTAQSVSDAPSIGWDLKRHSLTVAFSLITWIAFALILTALMAIASLRGQTIDVQRGAVWGMLAFFVVQLAPAAGLPPELPGTIAAPIGVRMTWWGATILSAGIGVAAIAFRPGLASLAIAAVLLVAPQIIGAPHPDTFYGVAPAELSALFTTRSLAVLAVSWVALGALVGWVWSKD